MEGEGVIFHSFSWLLNGLQRTETVPDAWIICSPLADFHRWKLSQGGHFNEYLADTKQKSPEDNLLKDCNRAE